MATILVGTFIAYGVDLRTERSAPDLSHLPRAARLVVTSFVWWERLIPLFLTFALLTIMLSVVMDEVPVGARLLIVLPAAASISGLGVGAFMHRVLAPPPP